MQAVGSASNAFRIEACYGFMIVNAAFSDENIYEIGHHLRIGTHGGTLCMRSLELFAFCSGTRQLLLLLRNLGFRVYRPV